MKVIVAGGRDFTHVEGANAFFLEITKDIPVTQIVSGCARGADAVGERLARLHSILPIRKFPADWDTHGKSAGYIRNSDMADYADMLIAFWDGKSKGTKHMIDLAEKKGLIVHVVRYTARYKDE